MIRGISKILNQRVGFVEKSTHCGLSPTRLCVAVWQQRSGHTKTLFEAVSILIGQCGDDVKAVQLRAGFQKKRIIYIPVYVLYCHHQCRVLPPSPALQIDDFFKKKLPSSVDINSQSP